MYVDFFIEVNYSLRQVTHIFRDDPQISSDDNKTISERKIIPQNARRSALDNLKHAIQQVWGSPGPTSRRFISKKGTEDLSVCVCLWLSAGSFALIDSVSVDYRVQSLTC